MSEVWYGGVFPCTSVYLSGLAVGDKEGGIASYVIPVQERKCSSFHFFQKNVLS